MAEVGKLFVKIASVLDDKGLKAATRGLSSLKGWVQRNRAQFKKLAIAGAAMGAAVAAGAIKAAKMAGIQQQAELTLAAAMKQAGTFTAEAHKHNLEYASSLQKMTTFGDEAIIGVQKMLTNFGIEGVALDKLTKATLDLAAAKGMDLKAAGDLVAKSVGSSTNALTRYGIEVKGAVGSTERAQTAVENISKLFGGAAQADAQTFSGRVKSLSNEWGDIVEKIGFKVIPIFEKLIKVVRTNIFPALEGFISRTGGSNKLAERLAGTLQFLIKIAVGVSAAFNLAGTGIAALMAAVTGDFKAAKIGFQDLKDQIESYGETLKDLSAEQLETTASTNEDLVFLEQDKNEQINMINEEQDAIDEEKRIAKMNKMVSDTNLTIKERRRMLADFAKGYGKDTKVFAAHTANKIKLDKEMNAKAEKFSKDATNVMLRGLTILESAEKLTWKETAKAFKQAMVERLRMWILAKVAEVMAEQIKSLAVAAMNTTITFGAAAYQLGLVLAAGAAGIASLRALPSLDRGGIVPGQPGQPVMVQALGGEQYLGRKSIGKDLGGPTIIIQHNVIADEESLEPIIEKVKDALYNEVKINRPTG